jgi:hypothetical protein
MPEQISYSDAFAVRVIRDVLIRQCGTDASISTEEVLEELAAEMLHTHTLSWPWHHGYMRCVPTTQIAEALGRHNFPSGVFVAGRWTWPPRE